MAKKVVKDLKKKKITNEEEAKISNSEHIVNENGDVVIHDYNTNISFGEHASQETVYANDMIEGANSDMIAFDAGLAPHFAEAALATGAIATDVAGGTAAGIAGISATTLAIGGGVLLAGGIAAASGGGGNNNTPTEPIDEGSIEYVQCMLYDETTYYNDDGSSNIDPAKYVNIATLSGGKDVDLSTLDIPSGDFIGIDGSKDNGVNEIKLTYNDVFSKGFQSTDYEDVPMIGLIVKGGSNDIVDLDISAWEHKGIEILDEEGGECNGRYNTYYHTGDPYTELYIQEGVQVI